MGQLRIEAHVRSNASGSAAMQKMAALNPEFMMLHGVRMAA